MRRDRCTSGGRENRLDDRILAAFEQAVAEGKFEVAEHLLKAVETLAAQDRAGGADGALGEAYLVVARMATDPAASP
jgi:hypothetical protein